MEQIRTAWTAWAVGALGACLAALWRWCVARIRKTSDIFEVMKRSDLALLHDRLMQACLHCIRQGWIDAYGMDNIERMYRAYSDLGGNGSVSALKEKAFALPQRKEDSIL